jgi:hypothetical protein
LSSTDPVLVPPLINPLGSKLNPTSVLTGAATGRPGGGALGAVGVGTSCNTGSRVLQLYPATATRQTDAARQMRDQSTDDGVAKAA